MQMQIRPATLKDAPRLAAANQAMALETEQKELDLEVLIKGVQYLLEDEQKGRYLVVENTDSTEYTPLIAAQLMLTREWSDWRAQWFWWIQSVYVWPEHRRKGLYRALYQEVQKQALAAQDVCGVRLYVEKENRAARQTYEKLGMKDSGYVFYEAKLL